MFYASMFSILSEIVWCISFHLTFVNRAVIDIGIYVSINIGKVKNDQIFLMAEHLMFSHSDTPLTTARQNSVRYRLPKV